MSLSDLLEKAKRRGLSEGRVLDGVQHVLLPRSYPASFLSDHRSVLEHAKAKASGAPWYDPMRQALELARQDRVQEADDLRQRIANQYPNLGLFGFVFHELYNEIGAYVAADQVWRRYVSAVERAKDRGAAAVGDVLLRARGFGPVKIEAEIPARFFGGRKKKPETVEIGTYPTMDAAKLAMLDLIDEGYRNGPVDLGYRLARQAGAR